MNMENTSLINFVLCSPTELEMIRQWRNSGDIKKWMYNSEDITISEHIEFIASLKLDRSKKYLLVKNDDAYIGVIDFIGIGSNKVVFGMYANPNTKLLGVGRVLDKLAIEYAKNELKIEKLYLEVFAQNIQVVNLHKKYDFHEVNRFVKSGREVVEMTKVLR